MSRVPPIPSNGGRKPRILKSPDGALFRCLLGSRNTHLWDLLPNLVPCILDGRVCFPLEAGWDSVRLESNASLWHRLRYRLHRLWGGGVGRVWPRGEPGALPGGAGFGGIRLPKSDTMPQKLGFVYRELMLLLAAHQPEVVAIEEVFYSANVKSALKLGQIRGVALLAAANCGLPVAEYAPLKIKSSVVGYGLAQKEQVQFMVTRLLRLECVPEPADAADALAIAICHLHTAQTLLAQTAAALGSAMILAGQRFRVFACRRSRSGSACGRVACGPRMRVRRRHRRVAHKSDSDTKTSSCSRRIYFPDR